MRDRDHLNRPVVVVTGMGVLTALGEGLAENWRRLTAGESGIRTISRFPLDGLKTTIAATVDFVGPPDQPAPDRMVEMAMRAGREAVAQAGLPAGTFPGPLVLAMAPFEMEWRQRLEIAANTGASPPTYADMIRVASSGGFSRLYETFRVGGVPDRIADAFGTQGSPIALTTACASGATALQIGLETIRRGETGAALIVGTDASITQETLIRFSLLQALSTRNAQPQSALRPFNKDRDGFVMGEGAGALVLESVAHAAARGATILGVAGRRRRTADSFHRTRSSPDGKPIIGCMQDAIADAGLTPDDIGYVNAHGTGTPENDKMEWLGIQHDVRRARERDTDLVEQVDDRPHAVGGRRDRGRLYVQALRDGVLPPTISYETPDPAIPIDCVPNVARTRRGARAVQLLRFRRPERQPGIRPSGLTPCALYSSSQTGICRTGTFRRPRHLARASCSSSLASSRSTTSTSGAFAAWPSRAGLSR